MKLETWRESKGLTRESVARLVGAANASVVMRWERGTVPRPNQMSRIYLLTGGQVQPNDFYDLPAIVTAEPLSPDHEPLRAREDAA